jgi:ketosteroid isomerase-like protein
VTPGEVIASYLAAAERDDWDTAYGFFADDVLISIPGDSAFAGEHRGRGAAIRYIESIRDHYAGGTIELELVDMLVSDERAALIIRERFLLGSGPPVEIRRANVYRVRDDRIAELSIFEADQYAVDALLRDVEPR